MLAQTCWVYYGVSVNTFDSRGWVHFKLKEWCPVTHNLSGNLKSETSSLFWPELLHQIESKYIFWVCLRIAFTLDTYNYDSYWLSRWRSFWNCLRIPNDLSLACGNWKKKKYDLFIGHQDINRSYCCSHMLVYQPAIFTLNCQITLINCLPVLNVLINSWTCPNNAA